MITIQTKKLLNICEIFSKTITVTKIRPITNLIQFSGKDGRFIIGSTDSLITITVGMETDKEFKTAVVDRSKLHKLLKLTSKDIVTLERKDGYIELKGDGKYKLEVVTENNEELELPLDIPVSQGESAREEVSLYKMFMKRNGFVINENAQTMFYRYCTINGKTITTDTRVLVITDGSLFDNELPPKLVSIISNFESGVFFYSKFDNGYLIEHEDFRIFYSVSDFESAFPVKPMQQYLDPNSFKYYAKVNSKDLLSAIQRLDVVKTAYDEPVVTLNFTKDLLTIKDQRGVGIEEICVQSEIVGETTKLFTTSNLLRVLKVVDTEFELYLGEKFIMFKDSLGYFVIAQTGA